MSTQPPSRTKFYQDKRNGRLMGVCSGIADYTGLDVTLVRIMFLGAVFAEKAAAASCRSISSPASSPTTNRASCGSTTGRSSVSGKASASRRPVRRATFRSRLRDIDRRLGDVKPMSPTENRSLAREIEQLR